MTESAPSSRPAGRTGRAPARLGLTDPDAGTRLADLGWWDGDAPVEGTELAVWALARSPDPDLALLALERLRESLDEGEWAALAEALRVDQGLRGRLFGVLGGSTALGDHLVAHPERWRSLQSESTPGRTYDPSVLPDLDERTRTLLTAVGAEHGAGPCPAPRCSSPPGSGCCAWPTATRCSPSPPPTCSRCASPSCRWCRSRSSRPSSPTSPPRACGRRWPSRTPRSPTPSAARTTGSPGIRCRAASGSSGWASAAAAS